MICMKHPALGNAYFPDAEQKQREADGWVRWPRTKEQKEGARTFTIAPALEPPKPFVFAPIPEKRGPGRPKK